MSTSSSVPNPAAPNPPDGDTNKGLTPHGDSNRAPTPGGQHSDSARQTTDGTSETNRGLTPGHPQTTPGNSPHGDANRGLTDPARTSTDETPPHGDTNRGLTPGHPHSGSAQQNTSPGSSLPVGADPNPPSSAG